MVVDAPCSGTGTLRRHPDLRWRLGPERLAEWRELQTALLAAALELVAPGGTVLYSTCSIEPEENEELMGTAARAAEVIDLAAAAPPDTPWLATAAGGLRVLPCTEATASPCTD